MKKVRCKKRLDITEFYFKFGGIYDVVSHRTSLGDDEYDWIVILDEDGRRANLRATNKYFTNSYFEDVTAEYRNEVIEEILM